MNKKTSYIIIFSLLVVLTIGTVFTDYTKQLGTILADASVPNPGHSLSEIEGGQDLATKEYVDTAVAGITQGSVTSVGTGDGLTGGPITSSGTISVDSTVVRTTGNQTIGGTKTFSSAVVLSTAGTATNHAVRADRTISTTNGITGGGNLTANRTLSLDSTVVRTTGDQTIAGTKTFTGSIVATANPVAVGAPIADNHAATMGYVNSAVAGSASKWITSGTNIYNANSGNVGIGTVSPTVKLDVVGVIRGTGVVTNRSGETRPTCNSSTEGMQWYDYNLKVLLLCNGTSWRYPSPLACGYNFTDPRDGNVYPTVQIGTQCWMAKNLAYLPSVVPSATGSETTPYYYVYGYNGTDVATAKAQANYATYGVLYNHPATVDACPTGWRMPTHDDWTDLERAICTSETCLADFPKNTTTIGWRGTDEGSNLSTLTLNGNNSSGFTALMSGLRDIDASFYSVGSNTNFWSSSEGGAGAWRRNLRTSYSTVSRNTPSKAYGFSVRCLKN